MRSHSIPTWLAVKLLVGRSKDLDLVRLLHAKGRIDSTTVRSRIDSLNIPVELAPRLLANFAHTMQPVSTHRRKGAG